MRRTISLTNERLDDRIVPAVTKVMQGADWVASAGLVRVWTDAASTQVEVRAVGTEVEVRDLTTPTVRSWRFPAAKVGRVAIFGGNGADRFVNRLADRPALFYGYGGNDTLIGSSAADFLDGGEGHDRLVGGNGSDTLYGGNGNDVIVSIDNGTGDQVRGDAGVDVLWVDQNGTLRDAITPSTGDTIQAVAKFVNGADRTLNGDRIADPIGESRTANFAKYPLFASNGPRAADVRQGAIGDCPVMAAFGAVAERSPSVLQRSMVDFGDGTYGVRLGDQFYRVDADLPVMNYAPTSPKYAGLGRENSLWSAILEKTFVSHLTLTVSWITAKNQYAALGGGDPSHVFRGFGAKNYTDFYNYNNQNSATWVQTLANEFATKRNVTVGVRVVEGSPLVGSHAYSVMGVTKDASGRVTSILLRNPWGVDGRPNPSNPDDGLVSVTPAQFIAAIYQISSATL